MFLFFVLGSSAISDTCMAMGEWVDNPHAESALSNILPCVDPRTTNQTLFKSKQVTVDLVNIVNGFIDTYANSNPSNHVNSNYYNQSGPVMPRLCYPYDSQLQDLPCLADQVSMANSSTVSVNVSLPPQSHPAMTHFLFYRCFSLCCSDFSKMSRLLHVWSS